MIENMTEVSAYMFESATSRNMTIREATQWLASEANVRTLKDKLERFAKGRDLRSMLVDGLMRNNPEAKREAVERKVRGWLNNSDRSIRKKAAIELCFVMELTVEEADAFLAMVCEETFHWRDPEEIVYIYALSQQMSYSQAEELAAEARELLKKRKVREQIQEDSFTHVIRKEIEALGSEEELLQYIQQAQARLGSLHNTAYQLFMDFMELLESAAIEDGLPESDAMTTRSIVRRYLNRNLIPRVKRGGKKDEEAEEIVLSAVQRGIYQSWPEEVALSRMKNRETDVTRKTLILLFLVTDGGESDFVDDSLGEQTREEVFESMYMRMNAMLKYCGFAVLDPRMPFDWLVMYCMCVQDVSNVDKKMRLFLRAMFPEGNDLK